MKTQTIKAEANGRVNLIGEHTDYNGGWVLPTAIPYKTMIELELRDDQIVTAKTELIFSKQNSNITYKLGEEKPIHAWSDYLQGTTSVLVQAGHKISGFNAKISSTVPSGSGLSSSAALLISLLKALRLAFKLDLSDLDLAKLAQQIENKFVGANVGIMDQMACSFATEGEALFLDTKTLAYERIQLPLEKIDLVVINSGVAHQHSNGDYNQRRSECEQACKILGISELRDLSEKDLSQLDKLPDVLHRRAKHVITENARVHSAVAAIKAGDMKKLGELFKASHLSMKNDYEVSISAIDTLVEICQQQPSTFGARLTGGGFGGSIVALVKKGDGRAVAQKVIEAYEKETGHKATVLVS